MAKIILDTVTGGYDLSVINNNFDKIETEFQNKVLYRDNPVGEVNTLQTDVDANSKRLYNLPAPTLASEAARLQDIQGLMNGAGSLVLFTPYKNISAINLQSAIQEEIDDLESTSASSGASLIGYTTETGTVKAALDRRIPERDLFSDIRSYSGALTALYVKGNTAIRDGGAGIFRVDSSDTTSPDNNGTILVDAVSRRWKRESTDEVNVKWFGAKGDGITNDSTAVQNAINTNRPIYFPSGTYLINVTSTGKIVIRGDGSTLSILKPFSITAAAFVYRTFGDYWTYHSEVRNIGFQGIGTKTGIGFAFSRTDPATYQVGDEYSQNVKFYGCQFKNLEKGVQFTFGNIGSEFYSCGFTSNKYGVYTLNNKFGGDAMHAGNKYFFGGDFTENECAFYCHDTTLSGFSSIEFNGTIFETNLIGWYIFSSGKVHSPVTFKGCHIEANGQISTGAATVTIDAWSGTTRSNQVLTKRTAIFDGVFGLYSFTDCGIFTDIYVKAQNAMVTAHKCRVETAIGFGGSPCTIDFPGWSSIKMTDPVTDGGFLTGTSVVTLGRPSGLQLDMSNLTHPESRWFIKESCSSRIASYGSSLFSSIPFTTGVSTSGIVLTGSVIAGGRIFSTCNEFTRASFGSSEYARISSPDPTFTTTAAYWVFTLDFQRVAGNPKVHIWDRSTNQFVINMAAPSIGKWYTFAAIAFSPGGQTLWIDFSGSDENCTWRTSAYQLHRFGSLEEAQAFIASGVYAGA